METNNLRVVRRLVIPCAISFLFLFLNPHSVFAHGENDKNGHGGKCKPPCLCAGANPIKPYTGNANREITDLTWLTIGEIPFDWVRYGNSRDLNKDKVFGTGHNWRHAFEWTIFNNGMSPNGMPILAVVYPDGSENKFTQNSGNPAQWDPPPGVGNHLTQSGTDFHLIDADSRQYHFVKLGTNSYRMLDFRDTMQNVYSLSYNASGKLIKVTEPAGRTFTIAYTSVGGVTVIHSVTSSDGRSVTYSYQSLGTDVVLNKAVYGDGTQSAYTYMQLSPGGHPLLASAVDPRFLGPATHIKYDYNPADTNAVGVIAHEMNGVTGEIMVTFSVGTGSRTAAYSNGRVQTYKMPWTLAGSVNQYIDGLGRTNSFSYDQGGLGFLVQQTDPLGRVTKYTNSRYGNHLHILYPDTSTNSWTRDSLDLILTYTDGLGRTTTYTRDSQHRITRIDYPDTTFETFVYNSLSQVVNHQFRNGGIEHNLYNTRRLKQSFQDAEENLTQYFYDGHDRLSKVIDARGNPTSYQYNERGLVTRVTHDVDGSFITYQYDEFGNLTRVIDELGHTWDYAYDEFRRVTHVTDHPTSSISRMTQYQYDLPGGVCACTHVENNPTAIILPSGKIKQIQYDKEWQKIAETVGYGTPDAATTQFQYDLAGNIVTTIDARLKLWVQTYDNRNRLNTSSDPLGNTTSYTYDPVGNRKTETRPDGGKTFFVYDSMNRLTKVTDPLGQVTKMGYDNGDNITSLTDPRGKIYSFTFDHLNRLLTMKYPDNSQEVYTWDSVNNLETYTTRAGQVMTYMYDKRNRETLCSWSDSTPEVSKSYDFASRLLTLSSSVSSLSYSYDDANELLSETQAIAGAPSAKTVSYQYDLDKKRSTLIYPDREVITYGYTGRNQISSITAGGPPPVVSYQYDLNGNRLTKTLENATATSYAWDDANRNTSIDHQNGSGVFASFSQDYDPVNRKKFVKHEDGKGDVFSYDGIDQVKMVQYNADNPDTTPSNPSRVVNYTLDKSGNRTSVVDNSVTTAYTPNNLNEYTKVGGKTFTYDSNGNLKTQNGWTYAFDAQNRMTGAVKTGVSASFAYDGRNRRVSQTINGVTTYFYFDGWQVIEERTASDAQIAKYFNGATVDEILARITTSSAIYYHHDSLGDVTHLTNDSGNLIEKYTFDVFGKPSFFTGSGGSISSSAYGNRFLFTGREFVSDIGLYDYRNRFYSVDLGRFLQTDPIKCNLKECNLYRYVGNDPTNRIDPFGLYGQEIGPATPGGRPIGVPEAPGVYPVDTYGGSTGLGLPLANVSNAFGNSIWANCVRGCLGGKWDPCKEQYRPNFAVAHAECFASCVIYPGGYRSR